MSIRGSQAGRRSVFLIAALIFVVLALGLVSVVVGAPVAQMGDPNVVPPPPYDCDTGNSMQQVIIPAVRGLFATEVSPAFNDVSIVFRYTTLMLNAAFDAVVPYHPTAVGVYSRLGRRPASESDTDCNINTAAIQSIYRMLLHMAPHRSGEWRDMMLGAGLDPDNESLDLTTPVGLGNAAAAGVILARQHDGMNQSGNYADTTGYVPVNPVDHLVDPSRWQPRKIEVSIGKFLAQVFVTPQWGRTAPYTNIDPRDFRVPPPVDSDPGINPDAYKEQVDLVLEASASLNDEQKMLAEHFDNKIRGTLSPDSAKNTLPVMDFIFLDFMLHMAEFDSGIVTWQEKLRFDAVRPFSAVKHVYGDTEVQAWGGPGKGTMMVPASEWQSFLPAADHPEYPSATTCVCSSYAQGMRRWFGEEEIDLSVFYPAGSSRIEPGVTPAEDLTINFTSWTELEELCGQSRVWAGVHFQAAVDESLGSCRQFGDLAYDYFTTLLDGTAPERGTEAPLPPDPRQEDRGG